MSDKQFDMERMIVRYLDGELSGDEEIELHRLLARDPHARRVLEEYTSIDQEVSAALESAVPRVESVEAAVITAMPRAARSSRFPRWWSAAGIAAAAMIAIAVNLWSPRGPGAHQVKVTAGRGTQIDSPALTSRRELPVDIMHNAAVQTGPRVRRNTGRDVFGVVGDDGNVYWIQVDRVRTLRLPQADGRGAYSREPL